MLLLNFKRFLYNKSFVFSYDGRIVPEEESTKLVYKLLELLGGYEIKNRPPRGAVKKRREVYGPC